MSVTKETTIWCDGCRDWEHGTGTATEIRKRLKMGAGWRVGVRGTVEGGLVDYCRRCAPDPELNARRPLRQWVRRVRLFLSIILREPWLSWRVALIVHPIATRPTLKASAAPEVTP